MPAVREKPIIPIPWSPGVTSTRAGKVIIPGQHLTSELPAHKAVRSNKMYVMLVLSFGVTRQQHEAEYLSSATPCLQIPSFLFFLLHFTAAVLQCPVSTYIGARLLTTPKSFPLGGHLSRLCPDSCSLPATAPGSFSHRAYLSRYLYMCDVAVG